MSHNGRMTLRNLDGRAHKEQKHRYERRKVREYLRNTGWTDETSDI